MKHAMTFFLAGTDLSGLLALNNLAPLCTSILIPVSCEAATKTPPRAKSYTAIQVVGV
mgnify:CR=1 FL=1